MMSPSESAVIRVSRNDEVTAVRLGDRPVLSPDVEFPGEMQGMGFTDRQWLVRRGDRLFQLTDVCYHVLRELNGQLTFEEIAASVTEKTEWMVSPELVRQVVQTKLRPLGLLDTGRDDLSVADEVPGRSPLQVGWRKRLAGPRALEPVAALLQVLYTPAILGALVAASVVAYGWFYLVHGITETVRAALYTPGGLLVTMALTLLAGAFHELGHAAALRYGGGKVGGIGVGLYLVYPTFYTDVTDAYRLGRWARLRTDLGGIYFHLVFGLFIIGLYHVSGRELLLAVVLVITADVLYQCLPFVRLDGYWALADLIGVPDLFSHVTPFLRSVLTSARQRRGTVSRLQRWVQVVFVVYVALTIPVLAVLGVLMVRGIPRFFTTAIDSLLYQGRTFVIAAAAGDFLLLAAIASQAALLSLSMLATVYAIQAISRTPLRTLWRWSRPTRPRRVVGALVAGAVGGLVIVMWAPDLPFRRVEPRDTTHFTVLSRAHVQSPVAYEQSPPVGGPHAPVWQNCGFYDAPIRSENAVHSLEHGAVWITYRSGLPIAEIETLSKLASSQPYVLVSPYAGLASPVVASAWGRQLHLESSHDARLVEFVRAFRLGPQAPEHGGPCSGGFGQPLRR
jgi:putative peptide zinc metalloprotease protein